MLLRIPSWRTQWQYWFSSVQLTEAMAGGSQVFCLSRSVMISNETDTFIHFEALEKEKDREREKRTTQGGIKAA
jgi:hypothetical protein